MRFNQQDERDRAVLQRLDKMSEAELAAYDDVCPKNLRHYLDQQKPWLEDEVYFLGIELGRPPSQDEIAGIILNERHSQRFRVFYALRFPEAVETQASVGHGTPC